MPESPRTQDYFQDLYLTMANSKSTDVDVTTLADFQVKGNAIGAIAAGIELDSYKRVANLVPQFADQQSVNIQLNANGAIPKIPATPASVVFKVLAANITPTPPSPLLNEIMFNIPNNTQITSSNSIKFALLSSNGGSIDVIYDGTRAPTVNGVSTSNGTNRITSDITTIPFSPPIVDTRGKYTLNSLTVSSYVDGTNQESDIDTTNRLIDSYRVPLAGNRYTDWVNIILKGLSQYISSVTKAVQIINAKQSKLPSTSNTNMGIYLISGDSLVSNTLLNQGLANSSNVVQYSRSVPSSEITEAVTVFASQDVIGVNADVNSVSTQLLIPTPTNSPYIYVYVNLQSTYTVNSLIIDEDGNTFKLSQLIQREVRRSVCNQPLGATLIYDSNNVPSISVFQISAIEQALDRAFGTSTSSGKYGNIFTTRAVYINNSSGSTISYTYKSSLPLNLGLPSVVGGTLQWIYDLAPTTYTGIGGYNLYSSNIEVNTVLPPGIPTESIAFNSEVDK